MFDIPIPDSVRLDEIERLKKDDEQEILWKQLHELKKQTKASEESSRKANIHACISEVLSIVAIIISLIAIYLNQF